MKNDPLPSSPRGGEPRLTLPLGGDGRGSRVALYGCTSYDFIAGGTGSGNVNHAYVVSLVDGLKNGGYTISEEMKSAYEQYIAEAKAAREKQLDEMAKKDPKNAMLAGFLPGTLPAEKQFTAEELAAQAEASDVAIMSCRWSMD